MIHVAIGTDTYGRVKAVGNTAIVTKFEMAQGLPVVALRSYYVSGPTRSSSGGVPFLVLVRKVKVHGVPLARLDRTSVVFAYMRALLAIMVLSGFILTFSGFVISLNGRPMDDFARSMLRFAEVCLALGIIGGVITYLVPTLKRRERAIRTFCGEQLGISIDPGKVVPEFAVAIREGLPPFENSNPTDAKLLRSSYVHQLILLRCNAATDPGREWEEKTDQLLDQLKRFEQLVSAPTEEAEAGETPRNAI